MVVHTPTKLEALRQSAAVRRAAAAEVPPSVLAAAQDAGVTDAPGQDLVAGGLVSEDPVEHDFDLWSGDVPPGARGIEAQVEVHQSEATETEEHANVTTRRGKVHFDKDSDYLQQGADTKRSADQDADKISVVSDVTPPPPPPPPPSSANYPQINPFTPEWFSQLIGAAVTAAATAVAGGNAGSSPSPSLPSSAPRRLNERKVPDFWEDKPEFWFRIFDAHLAHFRPSERGCFDALLPLLTPAARAVVHSVIRTPGPKPYSQARETLLRHFGRTPRQLARDLRDIRHLGDRSPSEFLEHAMSLLPDPKVLFEVVLLDALPPNARVAALQHSDVRAMARAADAVWLENKASAELDRATASVSAISLDGDDGAYGYTPPPRQAVAPTVASASREPQPPPKKKDSLCWVHARYGKDAYRCMSPNTCRLRGVIKPRPPQASGNGKAGSK